MHSLRRSITAAVAVALLASTSLAQTGAPQVAFDDGSAETHEQVQVTSVAGDMASIDLDTKLAGKRVCSVRVRMEVCVPGFTAKVGLYADDLALDPAGQTADVNSPLCEVSMALPVIGCDEELEFDTPDIVVPANVGVHAVFTWQSSGPDVNLCVDQDSTSGRSFSNVGGGVPSIPRSSGNWMIRVVHAYLPNRLMIEGWVTFAPVRNGSVASFVVWGSAPSQTWTIYGPGSIVVATVTTGSCPCTIAGEVFLDTSFLAAGPYYAKRGAATTPSVWLLLPPFGNNCPWGIGDDGKREGWFRPSGNAPAGTDDYVNVAMPEQPTAASVGTMKLRFRNEGCIPRTITVLVCPPIMWDTSGRTPDLSAPYVVQSVAIPPEVVGDLDIALPPFVPTQGAGPVHVVIQWPAGDVGFWVGVDSDGTDNGNCDLRPAFSDYWSGYSVDAYATVAVATGTNLMIRLE